MTVWFCARDTVTLHVARKRPLSVHGMGVRQVVKSSEPDVGLDLEINSILLYYRKRIRTIKNYIAHVHRFSNRQGASLTPLARFAISSFDPGPVPVSHKSKSLPCNTYINNDDKS